jgi:DNA-binding LacI/PurR family transcriptional regulator
LNNNPAISKKTRKRIQAIAAEHRFETHQAARRLSLNRSQTIALVYPESEHHRHMVTDPFFMEVLKGITSAAGDHEYDLLIAQPRKDITGIINGYIESRRADGIIYLGCCQSDSLGSITGKGAAFISCGSDRYENTCSVDCDNVNGGRLAADHLLSCGCRQPAFIGGPKERLETDLRYQGFAESMQAADVRPNPDQVVYGDYLSASGYNHMKQLITINPEIDSVFACSDLMAMGALEAMRESGKRVGKDMLLVGFDDIPLAQFSSPPLTTISQNIFKVGKTLVNKLIQYMQDGIVSKSILPVELVVRKTTAIR